MALSEAQKRAQQKYREKKKLAQQALSQQGLDHNTETVAPTTVEVVDNTTEKLSFKDRLLGKMEPVKKSDKKGSRGKKIDQNLITTLAPTLIATFTATYSRQLIKDPYKGCAPTQKEVLAMVGPFFNILSRYIEITGHASENTIDIISAIIASLVFGTRSYVTYCQIKDYEKDYEKVVTHARSNGHDDTNAVSRESAINAGNENTTNNERTSATNCELVRHTIIPNTDVNNDDSLASNGDITGKRDDFERMANLFARDRQGRVKLGLLTG